MSYHALDPSSAASLQAAPPAPAVAGASKAAPAQENTADGARVAHLPLAKFADAGLLVRVRSEILGEVVLFASDNTLVAEDEPLPVYRAAELSLLLDSTRKDLLALHAFKKASVATAWERTATQRVTFSGVAKSLAEP